MRSFLLVTVLLTALCSTSLRAQIIILPLGDSITRGGAAGLEFNAGWREPLYDSLTAAGDNFQFIGVNDVTTPGQVGYSAVLNAAGQNYQDGFSGYTSAQILSSLTGSPFLLGTPGSSVITPNLVLFMIGSNDVRLNVSLATLESNVTGILDFFADDRPQSQVFIAQTIPNGGGALSDSQNTELQQYNSWLAATVPSTYSKDHVVDMYDAFVTNGAVTPGYLESDNLHPSVVGYDAMANVWDNAIQAYVAPEPSPIALFSLGLIALLFLRLSFSKRESLFAKQF